ITQELLGEMLKSANRNVRREAARLVPLVPEPENSPFENLALRQCASDSDPEVRAQAIRSMFPFLVRPSQIGSAHAAGFLLRMLKSSLGAPTAPSSQSGKAIKTGEAYVVEFERYLIRLMLERSPAAVMGWLGSAGMSPEERVFAALALPAKQSAPLLAAGI